MSMRSYINAHCDAASSSYYDSQEFFGGGEGYDGTIAAYSVAETVAGVIEDIGLALHDDDKLRELYLSSTDQVDSSQTALPASWHNALQSLDDTETRVLSGALFVPVRKLGIATVGIVRRLPDAELQKAKGIGPGRAKILKALGHNANDETQLIRVIPADKIAGVLKPSAAS